MLEDRPRTPAGSAIGKDAPAGVERQTAEGDVHARMSQFVELGHQVRVTVRDLGGRWPVVGRRTPDGRGNPDIVQLEAVVDGSRMWQVRKAVGVESRHHEIA